MSDFNTVIAALKAHIIANVQTPFKIVEERFKLWADVPAAQQPALFILQPGMVFAPRPRGLPSKITIEVKLVIYFQSPTSRDIPSHTVNDWLEQIKIALDPSGAQDTQTLGNTVDHCWIEGRVMKDPGDLDQQGMIVIPVMILFTH